MVLLGFIILISGISVAYYGKDLAFIFFAQALIGFAIGICEPLLMGMSIHTLAESDQSTALGFHQTIYAVGMFSGPFLSGLLASKFGFQNMFLITSVSTFLLFILWVIPLGDGSSSIAMVDAFYPILPSGRRFYMKKIG